jgi:diguanylate cyclase (GGDEF)-like protein
MLRINRTAVTAAVGIVFVAIVTGSFVVGLVGLTQTAHVQARMLAENVTAAILSHDRRAATEVLGSLRHSPQVQAAELLGPDRRSFARYVRAGGTGPGAADSGIEGRSPLNPFFLQVRQIIADADGDIGTLLLRLSLDSLLRQTAWIAIITLAGAAASLWASSLLLRHLDRAVLEPLQALNDLMAKVHGQADFTVRARRSHIAEINALGGGFNKMIEKLHERDRRLEQLAFFDVLTGMPNRSAFLERLEREVQRAARGGHRLGLLFLDLDGFKQVNDTMGHDCGDRLLVEAAERIREALRPSDATARGVAPASTGHSARLGGDEFTVLIPDLHDVADALVVARRVGDVLRRPFFIEGRELAISASIGAAVFPEDGRDVPTLLQHADTAMYDAKRSGRDNSRRYSATLTKPATERLVPDSRRREAISGSSIGG